MAKRWLYLLTLFIGDLDTNLEEEGRFEVLALSPYASLGKYQDILKSQDYDDVDNPAAIGQFITWIGDKNTITIKKLRDAMTEKISETIQANQSYYGLHLNVVPASAVPARLKGKARLEALFNKSIATAMMKTAFPSNLRTLVEIKDSRDPVYYNFVTFESEEVTFQFKGRDWK